MAPDDGVQLRTLTPRTTDAEPSPAKDALRSSLRAAESDLGLKKRKSWFGSMKDAFHKGALQAKAAVDSMRGEQVKHEDESKHIIPESTATPEPRQSQDSATSTTPLKSHTFSPQLHRRRTFSPREAVSSLRHHLPGHGSRSKRMSVHTIAGRIGGEAPEIPSQEHFASPKSHDSDDIEQHRRKSSVASSLVGSIRGLTRRPTKNKVRSPTEVTGLDNVAENVPLPSSPINIPSAAPVLGLDLGQPAMSFLPSELPGSTNDHHDDDMRKLQDPANFALSNAAAKTPSLPLVPDEFKIHHTHPAVRHRATTPAEALLQLPTNENARPSRPRAPATPLPGTNLGMDLDDAHSCASSSGKRSQVFERSVTPTTEKDRKELRSMCSLDAIAEACTKKERRGSAVESIREERAASPASDESIKSNPFSPRGSIPSVSTVSCVPSDMPALERQESNESKVYRFELGNQAPVPIDDPFDDSHAAMNAPPSAARSVKLPLRLKVKGLSEGSGGSMFTQRSPVPVEDQEDLAEGARYTFSTPFKISTSYEQTHDMQERTHCSQAVHEEPSGKEQRQTSSLSPEHIGIISDDNTMTGAQSFWNSDMIYPDYEYPLSSDDSSDHGMSPHGGPFVPAALHHPEISPTSSPGKSTWKAGLGGEGGFRFSIDTWRPGTQPMPEPQPQTTPDRRGLEMSIDSVSVDETFETPLGSRTSNQSDRTPSMGNDLEFHLKRSERNMRYNALHQEHTQQKEQQKSSSPARMHARFIFADNRSGDMDANEAHFFPTSSSSNAKPSDSTPKKNRPSHARVSSEDSMAMSLRSASDNMEKLRAMLGGIDSDDEKSKDEQEGIFDAFTSASSPRSKRARGRKARGIRSDSPSPEVPASHPLPATPMLGPQKFSPTAARDKGSPNRFTVLDVEIEIASSPQLDDTDPALPELAIRQREVKENRVGSGSTLDQTLDVLSSPDSGYKADDSSEVQGMSPEVSGATRQVPKRYRSFQGKRRVLGEISGNKG